MKRPVTSILCVALLTLLPFSGLAQESATTANRYTDIEALRKRVVELQNELKQLQAVLSEMAIREQQRQNTDLVPSVPAANSDTVRWREARKAYEDGLQAETERHYAAAIGHYTRAVQLDPGNDSAFLHRGACFWEMGVAARALADYTESLRLQPNNSRSYQLRADAYYATGKYAEAINDLDQAILRDQQNVATYAQRARAYQGLGQNERALDDCRRAITLDPHFEQGLVCRAISLIAMGREREALPDLKTVFAMNPEASDARPASSAEALANALKPVFVPARRVRVEQRRQAEALIAQAKVRINQEEFRPSVEILEQAIRLDPYSALGYNSRSYAHLRLKEYELAIDDFTVAISLREGYVNAQHNLEVARWLSTGRDVPGETHRRFAGFCGSGVAAAYARI